MTTMSSMSSQRVPPAPSLEHRKQDELSPLVSSPNRGFFQKHVEPVYPRKNSTSSCNSSSSSNPVVNIDFDSSWSAPSPTSPRSDSRIRFGTDSPRLEPPAVSSSLPVNPGSHFQQIERSQSYDVSSTARSVRSSNSSVHITGPLREAVSDPRIIVNTQNGIIISGTLEGLVDRLITNFS